MPIQFQPGSGHRALQAYQGTDRLRHRHGGKLDARQPQLSTLLCHAGPETVGQSRRASRPVSDHVSRHFNHASIHAPIHPAIMPSIDPSIQHPAIISSVLEPEAAANHFLYQQETAGKKWKPKRRRGMDVVMLGVTCGFDIVALKTWLLHALSGHPFSIF